MGAKRGRLGKREKGKKTCDAYRRMLKIRKEWIELLKQDISRKEEQTLTKRRRG